jgi:diacylglycerol kinase family enzyme
MAAESSLAEDTIVDSGPALGPALGPWAKGKTKARALVLVNEAAGSVQRGAQDQVLERLAAHNIEAIETVSQIADLQNVSAKNADLVIVLGGDGTARAAAETFSDTAPLILLPGGTLNVLPHALYGALPWPEALEAALTRGRISRLTGGAANGRPFYVAAIFGAPTLLARVREAVREGRLLHAFRRFRHVTRRALSRSLAAKPEGGLAARAEAVGVLCPAYVGEVEGDALEWVRLDTARLTDMVRVGLRAVIGGWRDDETIDLHHVKRGEIRSLGIIPATLDGEPTTFVSKVRITMLRRGPRVIVVD